MTDISTTEQPPEARLTLKPARLELHSAKVQMLFAGVATFIVCIFSFAPSLQVGFLLDDYLHLDYIYRALHGSPGDFLHNFYGNWANSPLMLSYRPLVSLSLFIDYLLWGTNAFGFHLTNLLLHWGCSLMVGLIALELTGLRGNRLGACAPFWAALLFSVYPLHLEPASWVIGRVDLLCTLFALISVFGYLRFKLLREKYLFQLSLGSFIAAILCKEPAVVLPAVITAAEFLLFPYWQDETVSEFRPRVLTKRITGVLSFWFVLGMYFPIRWAILGTMVGGYGGSPLAALNHFFDKGTIERILFTENLDLVKRFACWELRQKLDNVLKCAYIGIVASGLARLAFGAASVRIILFLVVWMFASILPALQIWLISPNLVGSRLFFMASAPFVILLAFLALPAVDVIKKGFAKIFSVIGAILLFVVLTVWSFWLQFDQQSWTLATKSLSVFVDDVKKNLKEIDPAKSVLFLSLPSDCSGAGMVSRADYLRFMFQAPFQKTSESNRLIVLEDGNPEANYSNSILAFVKEDKIGKILKWSDSSDTTLSGHLSEWKAPLLEGETPSSIVPDANEIYFYSIPDNDAFSNPQQMLKDFAIVRPTSNNEWTLEQDGGRSFEQLADGALRIRPGNKDLLLLFKSKAAFSPLQIDTAFVQINTKNAAAPNSFAFFWISDSGNGAQVFESLDGLPMEFAGKNILILGSNKRWALTPEISAFGLKIPKGDYEIEFRGIELSNSKKL